MAIDPETRLPTKPETSGWWEWLKMGGPILLLTGLAFGVAWHFVEPAPPKRVTIATGDEKLMYYSFGKEYAKYFAANDIQLDVKSTKGSVENYKLLLDPDSGVDIAIVQSGTAPADAADKGLQAVAGIYYEPVWVFYRGKATDKPVTRLTQLAGKKIAIGEDGSGVQPLALSLLEDSGIKNGEAGTTFSSISANLAVDGLKNGTIDAAFFVSAPRPFFANAPRANLIRELIQMPGVLLMSFETSHAYGRRYPYLSPVTLYQGSIDTKNNLPDHDVNLVAPPATIIIRRGTHEAIIQLLVAAAQHFHGGGTLLAEPGTFPSIDKSELPVNKDAKYFLTNKPGFLHRTLPFWLASLIDRLLILLLPFLVVLLPLIRTMPTLYVWRIRARIYKWYKRVRNIDERLNEHSRRSDIDAAVQELVTLEKELQNVKVPLSYTEGLYNLRLHVGYVRTRMEGWLKQGVVA